MIQRFIEVQLQRLAVQFPIITITGPRQSGKTTLAQHYFKNYDYVNLEYPEVRAYATEDPKGSLADHPESSRRTVHHLHGRQRHCIPDRRSSLLPGSHPQNKSGGTQGVSGKVPVRRIQCSCDQPGIERRCGRAGGIHRDRGFRIGRDPGTRTASWAYPAPE